MGSNSFPATVPGRRSARGTLASASLLAATVGATVLAACGPRVPGDGSRQDGAPAEAGAAGEEAPPVFRIATFNIEELSRDQLDDVDPAAAGSHGAGRDPQALAAAAIIRRVRPDVLVLNEIDLPSDGDPAAHAHRFAERYLASETADPQAPPIDYPYAFAAPSNTGLLTGLDLDRDGRAATAADRGERAHGGDSYGFGVYPGQYAMALLSRYPLAEGVPVRTFQRFLWRDLPGHHLPTDYYRPAEIEILRLSSKSHWDVPLAVEGQIVHLWMSHPTPPVFDGPEDRNGRRNFDEIGFWRHYLDGSPALYDDAGWTGGYDRDEPFVIAGDLNAGPGDPAIYDGSNAIDQLLGHPRIQDPAAHLTSRGAVEHRAAVVEETRRQSPKEASALAARLGVEHATAEFLGGKRVDYLLPSGELEVVDGGVWWPSVAEDPEGHALAAAASDHRLMWLDLRLPGTGAVNGSGE